MIGNLHLERPCKETSSDFCKEMIDEGNEQWRLYLWFNAWILIEGGLAFSFMVIHFILVAMNDGWLTSASDGGARNLTPR